MRNILRLMTASVLIFSVLVVGHSGSGQGAPQAQERAAWPGSLPGARPPAEPLYDLEDAFLRWPLPPGGEAYGAIDGKHLHEYVKHLAGISRRCRDQGHPQFWGRITGTEGDAETAQWLVGRFTEIGLADVHIKPHDLDPQWIPQAWTVSTTVAGETRPLASAQPVYLSPGTSAEGLISKRSGQGRAPRPISPGATSEASRSSTSACRSPACGGRRPWTACRRGRNRRARRPSSRSSRCPAI